MSPPQRRPWTPPTPPLRGRSARVRRSPWQGGREPRRRGRAVLFAIGRWPPGARQPRATQARESAGPRCRRWTRRARPGQEASRPARRKSPLVYGNSSRRPSSERATARADLSSISTAPTKVFKRPPVEVQSAPTLWWSCGRRNQARQERLGRKALIERVESGAEGIERLGFATLSVSAGVAQRPPWRASTVTGGGSQAANAARAVGGPRADLDVSGCARRRA